MVWTRPGLPKQITGQGGAAGSLPAWKDTTGVAGYKARQTQGSEAVYGGC